MVLQRPPTLEEFVIHSILGWGREVADTIVDPVEEESRTTEVDPLPPPPRPSQDSIVFDLMSPPT